MRPAIRGLCVVLVQLLVGSDGSLALAARQASTRPPDGVPAPGWPVASVVYRAPGHMTISGVLGPVVVTVGVGDLCYGNCDGSVVAPALNERDFSCFLAAFAAGEEWANCDGSTTPPVLNTADMTCFLRAFAAGKAGSCPVDVMVAGVYGPLAPCPVSVVRGREVGSGWVDKNGWTCLGNAAPSEYRATVWPGGDGVVEVETGRRRARVCAHVSDWVTSRDCVWVMPGGMPAP